jgi:hypothetical protein
MGSEPIRPKPKQISGCANDYNSKRMPKICSFYGGDYEEWCLLGCYAVWLLLFLRSVRRLLVTASVVPSSPILDTLMKEALSSSETSVFT